MEKKEYTGSKLSRLKAMAAVGLIAATLAIPGLQKEVHAAGAASHNDKENVMTFNKNSDGYKRALKLSKEVELQNTINESRSRSSFSESLDPTNPNSPYCTTNNNVNLKDVECKTNNGKGIRIGEISNER